jgi:hypothetical protein
MKEGMIMLTEAILARLVMMVVSRTDAILARMIMMVVSNTRMFS